MININSMYAFFSNLLTLEHSIKHQIQFISHDSRIKNERKAFVEELWKH
jgi:hypothetical protein